MKLYRLLNPVDLKAKIFLATTVLLFCFSVTEGRQPQRLTEENSKKTVPRRQGISIRGEQGPSGHQTIGIDEDSVAVDDNEEQRLTFKKLMEWRYDSGDSLPPPRSIKRLHDKRVNIVGFMYPLEEGPRIRYFCLLRTTQTCCWGPRPQYNQYLFVEMAKPVQFYRLDPVICTGRFQVDPTPDEGFIYRLEGDRCKPVN